MKRSVLVKTKLICQGFQFSSDLDIGNAFIQSDFVLQFCKINCETVAVENFDRFLLVAEY